MLDRPLVVTDRTVAQGERLRCVRSGFGVDTIEDRYRLWRFYTGHAELTKLNEPNVWAFTKAIVNSCQPSSRDTNASYNFV